MIFFRLNVRRAEHRRSIEANIVLFYCIIWVKILELRIIEKKGNVVLEKKMKRVALSEYYK